MTPIHAITVAAAIVGCLCLVAFIVWEVFRHWAEIERLCRDAHVEPAPMLIEWRITRLPDHGDML